MGEATDDLTGSVVLITGAGRGIGRVLAHRYARAGARVAIAGRRREPLAETADLVQREVAGAEVHVHPCDVRSEQSCADLVGSTLERFGRLDVLLNNAAVPGRDQPVDAMDLENWEDTIATNVTGPMLLSREALQRAMVPAAAGNIQFFSSAAAKLVRPNKAHYAVAKLGLIALARTLALEVGPLGIRVNTLVLGAVHGDLLDVWAQREAKSRGIDAADVLRPLSDDTSLHRLVVADEVADVSLWLASARSSAITGQDINVTAGNAAR